MSVRDSRRAGFVWAATDALAFLRAHWGAGAAKGSSGRSVYLALTEIANDHKARTAIGADSSGRFRTSQKEIAERAIVSDRTAAKCCEELERIGLLLIECDRDGENRPGRPSFYTLVEPGQTSEGISDVEGGQRTKGFQTPSEAVSDVSTKGTKKLRTSLYREKKNNKKEEGARIVETDESVRAWESAKSRLHQQLPPEKFDVLRELVVIGECAGRLVLGDYSNLGARDWRDRAIPLILEAVEGFDVVEILDELEVEQADPLTEWEVWLGHFHETTGRTAMTGSKVSRELFAARRKDNGPEDPPRSLEELTLATIGCHSDERLRQQGFDRPETILRESNIGRYIELGRQVTAARRTGVADPALAAITGRPA